MAVDPHPREADLFARLNALGITHHTEEHSAMFTVKDGLDIKAGREGGQTKNLFLKDKSGQFVLISAHADTRIRLNRLYKHIDTKRLSFGSEDALLKHLGVRPGSVTVFSVINDQETTVRLILDRALWDHDTVWFHPLRNTASTQISPDDIVRFARSTGHEPLIMDFQSLAEESDR